MKTANAIDDEIVNCVIGVDCDGVLRNENGSYLRCINETVAHFSDGIIPSEHELKSITKSNNDWERAHNIILNRGIKIDFDKVKDHFQKLYLGEKDSKGRLTGYINNEEWLLGSNEKLAKLSQIYPIVVVSGAPRDEVLYALEKNHASKYFCMVLGMDECIDKSKGIYQANKRVGIEKIAAQFNPQRIYFCDDRPSPIEELSKMENVYVTGVLPPAAKEGWRETLKNAGAKQVFYNVGGYFDFILRMHEANENKRR